MLFYYYLFIRGDNEPFAWRHQYSEAVKCRDFLCKELHYKKEEIAICRPKGQNDGYFDIAPYIPTRIVEPIWKTHHHVSWENQVYRAVYGKPKISEQQLQELGILKENDKWEW